MKIKGLKYFFFGFAAGALVMKYREEIQQVMGLGSGIEYPANQTIIDYMNYMQEVGEFIDDPKYGSIAIISITHHTPEGETGELLFFHLHDLAGDIVKKIILHSNDVSSEKHNLQPDERFLNVTKPDSIILETPRIRAVVSPIIYMQDRNLPGGLLRVALKVTWDFIPPTIAAG